MVADARDYITTAWYPSVFPALAIMLVVLGANLLGDWLRDVLDPRLRPAELSSGWRHVHIDWW